MFKRNILTRISQITINKFFKSIEKSTLVCPTNSTNMKNKLIELMFESRYT